MSKVVAILQFVLGISCLFTLLHYGNVYIAILLMFSMYLIGFIEMVVDNWRDDHEKHR